MNECLVRMDEMMDVGELVVCLDSGMCLVLLRDVGGRVRERESGWW